MFSGCLSVSVSVRACIRAFVESYCCGQRHPYRRLSVKVSSSYRELLLVLLLLLLLYKSLLRDYLIKLCKPVSSIPAGRSYLGPTFCQLQ